MTREPEHDRSGAAKGGLILALLLGCVLATYTGLRATPREHRRAGNETAALAALERLVRHQESFRNGKASGVTRYATSLGELGSHAAELEARWRKEPSQGDLQLTIDPVLATGTRQGYVFSITRATDSAWSATATPSTPGKTGHRSFYVDQSGIIRFSPNGLADGASRRWDQLSDKWPSPEYDAE